MIHKVLLFFFVCVFFHLGFKFFVHCLMLNLINIFVVDELISHKQIVHETLVKITNVGNRNLLTITHTKSFRHHIFGKLRKKNPHQETCLKE